MQPLELQFIKVVRKGHKQEKKDAFVEEYTGDLKRWKTVSVAIVLKEESFRKD